MKSNFCDHRWRGQRTFKRHTTVEPRPIYRHTAFTNDSAIKSSTIENSIGKTLAAVSRIAKMAGLVLIGLLGFTLFIPYMIAEILFDVDSRDDEENETFHRRTTYGMASFNEHRSDNAYPFTDPSIDTTFGTSTYGLTINPASGLPMLDDMSGVDIGGNLFGTNRDHHH